MADLPKLPTHPPEYVPTGRYTPDRKAIIDDNHPGDFLWPEERKLMHWFMCAHESAFAWNDAERGKFREDFYPPVDFPVVPHTPWMLKNIPIPPGNYDKICSIIKDKIDSGIYEDSNSSYRTRWFCVVKKDGTSLRIVHSLEPLNAVTIRHSGVTPVPDHMAEGFAGRACGATFDLYVGYDERPIAESSRDLTTFQTPFGAKRLTTLPMGWTNSVPIFHDDVTHALREEIPHVTIPYIDDVPCKGPKSTYSRADGSFETIPENTGIRRFVWEHFQNINRVVQRIKYVGGTFSGKKSFLCVQDYVAVGQRCTPEGRRPETIRVEKVLDWGDCHNVSDVRGFLGTVGTCRIFIRDFARMAHPLVHLTRKDVPFEFDDEHRVAMDSLKQALIDSPALRPIDYQSSAPVLLAVDTSYIAVGYILGQLDEVNPNRRYVNRFGSITLNDRERRFSQPKLELYGLFRTLRANKMWLIGVRNLRVEVDARYIKGMLNNPDIAPSASMNRWIVSILLFHFELVHVAGRIHGPDGLSRRPPQPQDLPEPDDEDEFEDWVDQMYGFMHIINPLPIRAQGPSSTVWQSSSASITPGWEQADVYETEVVEPDTPGEGSTVELPARAELLKPVITYDEIPRSNKARRADAKVSWTREWLQTLARPPDMDDKEYSSAMRYATQFFFVAGKLWRRHAQGAHTIVVPPERRLSIMTGAHDKLAHHGFWATKQVLAERFWWPFFGSDLAFWVRTCYECQIRQTRKILIPPIVAIPAPLYSKAYCDTFKLPKSTDGYSSVAHARCALSAWSEFLTMKQENTETLARWIFEQLICRWGALYELVTDNGGPWVKALGILEKKHGIKHIRVSGYNSRANGLVEHGHFDIRDAAAKLAEENPFTWTQHIHHVFWADRTMTRKRLGCSPYFAVTGTHPLMPLDLMEATWMLPPPTGPLITSDLLIARARALEKREEDLERLRSKVYSARRKRMEEFEAKHAATIRDFDFKRGELVLVRNTSFEKHVSSIRKMRARYYGPMVVISKNRGGAYVLSELNGTLFHRPYAAFRLIPFFARRAIPLPPLAEFLDVPNRLPEMEDDKDDGRPVDDSPDERADPEEDAEAREEDLDALYAMNNDVEYDVDDEEN